MDRKNAPDILGDAASAARSLLGYKLVHTTPEGLTSGYIVETEAYDQDDPASHSFGGKRGRNLPMFGPAGTIYVYFTYGMHYCVNIVTGPEGHGQAVLIRALEPVDGIDLMNKRRRVDDPRQLTNGPAKLVQAMGITKAYSGSNIFEGPLRLVPAIIPEKIIQTTRVGIKKAIDQPWRFYIAGNGFVSRV